VAVYVKHIIQINAASKEVNFKIDQKGIFKIKHPNWTAKSFMVYAFRS
jgi:hypothetical protein